VDKRVYRPDAYVARMIPQRLTLITIGARDMGALREFYLGWGWKPIEGDFGGTTFFDLGGTRLAVWDATELRDEAAPGEPIPPPRWTSVTFAIHVASREEVDRVYTEAVALGATEIDPPSDREWGGRSGYVADPESTRWEVIWSPLVSVA
jgi:catechol 2,3-dioxygenase-like lactoylglutathione lyase family enzyme